MLALLLSLAGFSGYVAEVDAAICLSSNSNYISGMGRPDDLMLSFTSVGMNAELPGRWNMQAYNYAQCRLGKRLLQMTTPGYRGTVDECNRFRGMSSTANVCADQSKWSPDRIAILSCGSVDQARCTALSSAADAGAHPGYTWNWDLNGNGCQVQAQAGLRSQPDAEVYGVLAAACTGQAGTVAQRISCGALVGYFLPDPFSEASCEQMTCKIPGMTIGQCLTLADQWGCCTTSTNWCQDRSVPLPAARYDEGGRPAWTLTVPDPARAGRVVELVVPAGSSLAPSSGGAAPAAVNIYDPESGATAAVGVSRAIDQFRRQPAATPPAASSTAAAAQPVNTRTSPAGATTTSASGAGPAAATSTPPHPRGTGGTGSAGTGPRHGSSRPASATTGPPGAAGAGAASTPSTPHTDPCNRIKCALNCESECGWSRPLMKCVAGLETTQTEIDQRLGDCTALAADDGNSHSKLLVYVVIGLGAVLLVLMLGCAVNVSSLRARYTG